MAAEQMIFDIANSLYGKIINFCAMKKCSYLVSIHLAQIQTLNLIYLLTGYTLYE